MTAITPAPADRPAPPRSAEDFASLAARVREKLRGTLRVARLQGMLSLLIGAIPKIRPGARLCGPGEQ